MSQSLLSGSQKKRTMSWQLPFGAFPHLSGVICMRPCSPAPPTRDGSQPLSCMAKDASKIEGTVSRAQQSEVHATSNRTRTVINGSIFLECGDNAVTAGRKRSIPCTIQGHGNKLFDFNTSRRPAVASNATIDPVNVAIGPA